MVGIILSHYLSNVVFKEPDIPKETPIVINVHSPNTLQNILTPSAWATYERYGYPFDRVSTENSLGTIILYKMTPEDWKTIFAREQVRVMMNFPDLMDQFLERVEDPERGAQLKLVFFTEDREIGFTVQFGSDENPTYVALLEQLQQAEFNLITNPPMVSIDEENRTLVPEELPEPEESTEEPTGDQDSPQETPVPDAQP